MKYLYIAQALWALCVGACVLMEMFVYSIYFIMMFLWDFRIVTWRQFESDSYSDIGGGRRYEKSIRTPVDSFMKAFLSVFDEKKIVRKRLKKALIEFNEHHNCCCELDKIGDTLLSGEYDDLNIDEKTFYFYHGTDIDLLFDLGDGDYHKCPKAIL